MPAWLQLIERLRRRCHVSVFGLFLLACLASSTRALTPYQLNRTDRLDLASLPRAWLPCGPGLKPFSTNVGHVFAFSSTVGIEPTELRLKCGLTTTVRVLTYCDVRVQTLQSLLRTRIRYTAYRSPCYRILSRLLRYMSGSRLSHTCHLPRRLHTGSRLRAQTLYATLYSQR